MLKKFKVTHLELVCTVSAKVSAKVFCTDAGVMWHPEFAGVMLNRDP
jgi:hypothetical protein